MRNTSNFLKAQYLALDFDDGRWMLSDAETWCKGLGVSAIIGTSKSHLKEKVKPSGKIEPAMHRFRIVIPFSAPIESYAVYRAVMEHIFKDIPTDQSCKDGARFFWPCKEIYTCIKGDTFPIPEVTPKHTVTKAEQKDIMAPVKDNPWAMPSWITRALAFGVPPGQRNITIYKIAANLSLAGYDHDEIIRLIMLTPGLQDLSEAEIEQAVRNGFQAGAQT